MRRRLVLVLLALAAGATALAPAAAERGIRDGGHVPPSKSCTC
jgi:hypothetical protein